MFAQALRLLGAKCAYVVHGHDGLDEISICAPTRISELREGMIRTYDISPEQYFGQCASPATLTGGDPAVNAVITRNVLNGGKGPCRDVVLINAAAALVVAGKTGQLNEGIQLAARAIDSGAATAKLDSLIRFTTT
jgi:anthranilate phosphoribosyltransferase